MRVDETSLYLIDSQSHCMNVTGKIQKALGK